MPIDLSLVNAAFHPHKVATGEAFKVKSNLATTLADTLENDTRAISIIGTAGGGKSSLALAAVHGTNYPALHVSSGRLFQEPTLDQYLDHIINEITKQIPIRENPANIALNAAKVEDRFQIKLRAIADGLFSTNSVIIFDDVHELSVEAQQFILFLASEFYDKADDIHKTSRLITCSIGSSFRSAISTEPRFARRFVMLELSPWTPKEMRQFSYPALREVGFSHIDEFELGSLHYLSCGTPYLLHLLCREVSTYAHSANTTNFSNLIRGFLISKPTGQLAQHILAVIDKVGVISTTSNIDQLRLLRSAVFALVNFEHDFTLNEISTHKMFRILKEPDIAICIDALVTGNIFEKAGYSDERGGNLYRCRNTFDKIALRFSVAKSNLGDLTDNKKYKERIEFDYSGI